MSHQIKHKVEGWVAASGFYEISRAEEWLAKFNPQMWMDKTLRAEDFEIVTEGVQS